MDFRKINREERYSLSSGMVARRQAIACDCKIRTSICDACREAARNRRDAKRAARFALMQAGFSREEANEIVGGRNL